jgi:glucose-6-phosphate isomerase
MKHAVMDPFSLALDWRTGSLEPATSAIRRHLSDMRGMYADAAAEHALIASGDPLIYEVLLHDVPAVAGQLLAGTTVLYPGRVGDEYYMTKGHYHAKLDTAEVYLGLQGHGRLLLQADGALKELEMRPGSLAYIPPSWAHRTVNTGDEPLIFLAVCPADAGHDYASIERDGFAGRVVAPAEGPVVVRMSDASR